MSRIGEVGTKIRAKAGALMLAFVLLAGSRSDFEFPLTAVDSTPAESLRFARELEAAIPPTELERELFLQPDRLPAVLRALGNALVASSGPERDEIEGYITQLALANALRLSSAGPPWTQNELDWLLAYQLIDPVRFTRDAELRARVTKLLPLEMSGEIDRRLRVRQIAELNGVIGFDYESAERVEHAWGLVPRLSRDRRVPYKRAELLYPDDSSGPIIASIFCLTSDFVDVSAAEAFLSAQLSSAPSRITIVMTDQELKSGLEPKFRNSGIEFVDTFSRRFTPWPRDPFSVMRRENGQVVFVRRPNPQEKREEDLNMPRQLVAAIPEALDLAWKGAAWSDAPLPFHNGQVLVTTDSAWVSMHALEWANLETLALDRIPKTMFDSIKSIDRYLDATRRSARRFEQYYGRKTRFVHPLPNGGSLADRKRLVEKIYGGAGFDLDSLVTIVPGSTPLALVGDLELAREFVGSSGPQDWKLFASTYSTASVGLELKNAIEASFDRTRARRLQSFLDMVASQMRNQKIRVERIPLYLLPVSLLRDRTDLQHDDFLLGWNNVVLERISARLTATAFASGIARADQQAIEQFEKAGARLILLPPIVRSVVLNGGYRCASSNIRPLMSERKP